ncbi:hypothetical protein PM082_013724 [Marasmius tenuissimus]|nr:hypothetical protein PM082_013724 [Marasmius tenuissimus]
MKGTSDTPCIVQKGVQVGHCELSPGPRPIPMSNSTLFDRYLPLLQVGQVITLPVVTVLVMCIVYGFYVLLFGLCVYVLQRGEIHRRKLYITWTSILFLLSTSTVVAEMMLALNASTVKYVSVKDNNLRALQEFSLGHNRMSVVLRTLIWILCILANIVADSMLIYRCYVIWGSRKYLAVPLAILSCGINVVSIAGTVMTQIGREDMSIEANVILAAKAQNVQVVSLIISASFNLALTLLTAGRIWWITRALDPSKTRAIRTINKITLESGMLYPLVMILHLFVINFGPYPPLDTFPLVVLTAGIAPTPIIVLTRLSIHMVEDTDATYSRNNYSASFRLTERSLGLSRGMEVPRVPCVENGTKVMVTRNRELDLTREI